MMMDKKTCSVELQASADDPLRYWVHHRASIMPSRSRPLTHKQSYTSTLVACVVSGSPRIHDGKIVDLRDSIARPPHLRESKQLYLFLNLGTDNCS